MMNQPTYWLELWDVLEACLCILLWALFISGGLSMSTHKLLSSLRRVTYFIVNWYCLPFDDDLYRIYDETSTQFGQKNTSINRHGWRTIYECFDDTYFIIYAKHLSFYSLLWGSFWLKCRLKFYKLNLIM